MTILRRLFLLLFLLLPITGSCQSLGYMDADNLGEAMGLMKTSIVIANTMRRECVARFPSLQEEIDRNFQNWKIAEANNIRKTEQGWNEAIKDEPGISGSLDLAEKAVLSNFEILSKAKQSYGNEVLIQYCRNHFSALASGVWRVRTPKTYEYLDGAN